MALEGWLWLLIGRSPAQYENIEIGATRGTSRERHKDVTWS